MKQLDEESSGGEQEISLRCYLFIEEVTCWWKNLSMERSDSINLNAAIVSDNSSYMKYKELNNSNSPCLCKKKKKPT